MVFVLQKINHNNFFNLKKLKKGTKVFVQAPGSIVRCNGSLSIVSPVLYQLRHGAVEEIESIRILYIYNIIFLK